LKLETSRGAKRMPKPAKTRSSLDKLVVAKAFKCEVDGQFLPIQSFSGGNPTAEKATTSSGASKHNESTMGHNSISELTVLAYVTPDCKIVSNAAHSVVNRRVNQRYTITITEMAKDKSVIKTKTYKNCLFTSLDYPTVTAGSGEILVAKATFKPEVLQVS
jgi:hypothetical protein